VLPAVGRGHLSAEGVCALVRECGQPSAAITISHFQFHEGLIRISRTQTRFQASRGLLSFRDHAVNSGFEGAENPEIDSRAAV